MGPYFRYRNLSKEQREISKSAVSFVLNKFCPIMQRRMLVLVRGVKGLLDKTGEYGSCSYIDSSVDRRVFEIEIDKGLSLPVYIRTLMHELVHVKQYAKNEMKYLARSHKYTKWHNEKIDTDSVDYWELPWEIEAHGREEGLTQQFIQQYPQWKKACVLNLQ